MDAESILLRSDDNGKWLHGRLRIDILKIDDLPRMDIFSKGDPYVTIHLGYAKWARSPVVLNSCNPVFDYSEEMSVCHKSDEILFKIKDQDTSGSTIVGECTLTTQLVKNCSELTPFVMPVILQGKFSDKKIQTKMFIKVQFTEVAYNDEPEVPKVYWNGHTNGHVRLFHDAHVLEEHKQEIPLSNGTNYNDTSLWELVYERISNAKKLIYINSWAVFQEIRLVRDRPSPTLGELLLKKADEGVEVVIMVWDEALSISYMNDDGLMGTHDEELYRYFEGTKVNCMKLPRVGYMKKKSLITRILFSSAQRLTVTHHQKTIVCDVPSNDKPRICCFVGGLDLCDGRYDTAEHCLYRNMQTDLYPANDYHNPADASFDASNCLRQPWHDTHSYIEGNAAWHVLQNFRERYNKQAPKNAPRLTDFREALGSDTCDPDSEENWNTQIFRSIDDNVAEFEDSTATLSRMGETLVDKSVHEAYVHQIRRAKRFIYIENQYFLGSSHLWHDPSQLSQHSIPVEIAKKICNKIENDEEFCCYVVMPMWPEGPAPDIAIQEIMHFQHETRKMMYGMIARAITKKGLNQHPLRYLAFFCLGNREEEGSDEGKLNLKDVSVYGKTLAKSRRYMVYVHSKTMIVDDEYVITGSANINMRSMAGMRDTEICMGSYQPAYRATENSSPQGQVYGFRRACMGEHVGRQEDVFEKPWTEECIKRIRDIANENWKIYAQDEPTDMDCHLLPMPFIVDKIGMVSSNPDYKFILDTTAPVIGEKSDVVPDYVTT
eukprot:CFRG1672T1